MILLTYTSVKRRNSFRKKFAFSTVSTIFHIIPYLPLLPFPAFFPGLVGGVNATTVTSSSHSPSSKLSRKRRKKRRASDASSSDKAAQNSAKTRHEDEDADVEDELDDLSSGRGHSANSHITVQAVKARLDFEEEEEAFGAR